MAVGDDDQAIYGFQGANTSNFFDFDAKYHPTHILLNQNYRLIKDVKIGKGGISEVSVDVRIIMREAVLANATILVVCHNHPSGNLVPSRQDDMLTKAIRQACDTMRLHYLDQVIITDGQYFSYHESGKV